MNNGSHSFNCKIIEHVTKWHILKADQNILA